MKHMLTFLYHPRSHIIASDVPYAFLNVAENQAQPRPRLLSVYIVNGRAAYLLFIHCQYCLNLSLSLFCLKLALREGKNYQ